MKTKKWDFLTGDINYQLYGGKWYRKTGDYTYHVIELVNMIEATGEENQITYYVQLEEIDLTIADLQSACECFGIEMQSGINLLILVECISSYGQYAPMGNWQGNNYRELIRQAKRESDNLVGSDLYHENQLARSVNLLGSSALEYARGDYNSAIIRGIANDNSNAKIMGKIYGLKAENIEEIEGNKELKSLFTCQLYCNPPERLKNNNRIQCREFNQDDMKDYTLCSDSQDIDFWVEFIGLQKAYRKNITACMIKTSEGDLIDIWLSESSRPYDLIDGWYNSLRYYAI